MRSCKPLNFVMTIHKPLQCYITSGNQVVWRMPTSDSVLSCLLWQAVPMLRAFRVSKPLSMGSFGENFPVLFPRLWKLTVEDFLARVGHHESCFPGCGQWHFVLLCELWEANCFSWKLIASSTTKKLWIWQYLVSCVWYWQLTLARCGKPSITSSLCVGQQ